MKAIDIDYAQFMNRLVVAADKGQRIEPKEKQRWASYVREHKIREAGFKVYCKSICETVQPVIMDTDDDWSGFYLYSKQDMLCLKFDPGLDPAETATRPPAVTPPAARRGPVPQ